METNEPLNDLLKTLEVSLTSMLNRVRTDPWSLLIFQTLIWSFRRWAIHHLMLNESTASMHDYLWDSHIDLVRDFAPDGLKEFAIVWLNPTNVADRVDILEELNAYFLFIVDKLDLAIDNNNDEEQDNLSTFLDDTITEILEKWLVGREEYKIYPGASDSADSFSTQRIFTIMQTILEKHTTKPVQNNSESSNAELAEAQQSEGQEAEAQQPEAQQSEAKPKAETISSALKRRRTLRVKRQPSTKITKKAKRNI